MSDALPTKRTLLLNGCQLLVWCQACLHQHYADLQGLIDNGRGGVPIRQLRFRCSRCRSRLTDLVVTGGVDVKPWCLFAPRPATSEGRALSAPPRRPGASEARRAITSW